DIDRLGWRRRTLKSAVPARGDLLPPDRNLPTVIGEPTVVKPASRIAIPCRKGGDRPADRCPYRHQAMSSRRQRNLHLRPRLATRPAAGLKQVQSPDVC